MASHWAQEADAHWEAARKLSEQGQPHLEVARQAAKAQLLDLQEQGLVSMVEILACPDSCVACLAQERKKFTLQQALEALPIPHPACGRGWCRCEWLPAIDD
jgi:hypothetical protein